MPLVSRSLRRALGVLAILTTLAVATIAQDPADTFDDAIDVRVVHVEVVVTDADGNPVRGLSPKDFRLTVDGSAESIDYFSEIHEGVAQPLAAAVDPVQVDDVPTPAVEAGTPVGTSYLLFVDRFFGIKRDLKRVLGELQEAVAGFGPQDRMAIVGYDGRRLDAIVGWTTGPAAIARALDQAATLPSYGVNRLGERNLFERETRSGGATLIQSSGSEVVRDYILRLDRQVSRVLKAATTAARTFADAPGRKVLLLTVGGWPIDPTTFTLGVDPASRFRTEFTAGESAFEDLTSTANLLGFTIYPIDLPGKTASSSRVDEPLGAGGERATNTFDERIEGAGRESVRESLVESVLIEAAAQTGGIPLINGARDTALVEVRADLSSYYWLGFSPERRRNDQTHSIAIEVLRPGLVARSRTSFRDLSRRAEVTMQVESHLLFESPLEAEVLGVELGKPKRAGGAGVHLPVTIRIPMDQVTMLPSAKGFSANLELRVAIVDEEGDRNAIPIIPIQFSGAQKPAPGQHVSYETTLAVRIDKQRLVLALHDLHGDKVLAASVEVHPKKM